MPIEQVPPRGKVVAEEFAREANRMHFPRRYRVRILPYHNPRDTEGGAPGRGAPPPGWGIALDLAVDRDLDDLQGRLQLPRNPQHHVGRLVGHAGHDRAAVLPALRL